MRKLTLMLCLFMASYTLSAQEFMHSFGGKYLFYGNSDGLTGGVIQYSPRLNFNAEGNSTFSIGTHFGLGFNVSSRSNDGGSSSFILDLPLVAEYNVGFGSTSDADGSVGAYAGAGYGIHRASMSNAYGSGSATLHGPVFTGGVRFLAGAIGAFEVGASYNLDLKTKVKEAKSNIFGISVSYIFGFRGSAF